MKIKILVDPSSGTNPDTAVGTVHDAIINHLGNYCAIFGVNGTMWNLYTGSYEMTSAPAEKTDPIVNNSAQVPLHDAVGGPLKKVTLEFYEKPWKGEV